MVHDASIGSLLIVLFRDEGNFLVVFVENVEVFDFSDQLLGTGDLLFLQRDGLVVVLEAPVDRRFRLVGRAEALYLPLLEALRCVRLEAKECDVEVLGHGARVDLNHVLARDFL